jgi:hypothetical protein
VLRHSKDWPPMSESGLVSRASLVPFGFGDQVVDPKPPRAAVVKSHNVGAMIPAGKIERGERKRTASEASLSRPKMATRSLAPPNSFPPEICGADRDRFDFRQRRVRV